MAEVSDKVRHTGNPSPLLSVCAVYGSAGHDRESHPWEVSKTLLAQQILFCVRKEKKDAKTIARGVKADVSYVREHLGKMTGAEVLSEREGKYRASCILFDKDDVERLKRELGKRGEHVAEIIKEHEETLSAAIGQLSVTAQGFDEGYLRWLILPTMVLNFGIARRLDQDKGLRVRPPARPCGGLWFFKPFLIEAPLGVELGCNLHMGCNIHSREAGHAQYWNSELGVTMTEPTAEELLTVYRLAAGPLKADSLIDVFSEDTVADMIERGLVRKDGETIRAAIPVFLPKDGDILDPVLAEIVEDVIERAYAEYPDDINAVLDSLGFSFVRGNYPAHVQELSQLGAVRALVKKGILSNPSSPAPPRLGVLRLVWNLRSHGLLRPHHARLSRGRGARNSCQATFSLTRHAPAPYAGH